ncbi:hypothetical protein KFY57_27155, partial [Salmonella enterica subsp. enterica serovar Typhimurium]|nr:hypothetical protein [Salmonella enterica subsp. enterica serovar Typhimurium]
FATSRFISGQIHFSSDTMQVRHFFSNSTLVCVQNTNYFVSRDYICLVMHYATLCKAWRK